MLKKIIFVLFVTLFIFTAVIPVDAQTVTPSVSPVNQGFFGEIANFFSNFLHRQSGQAGSQMQGQNGMPMQGVTPGQPVPSGMTPMPSGRPNYQTMQQYRLDQLVKEGKITQTQEQEILTELTTVQNQLKTWAQSEGIDPSYVMGGPMMMGSASSNGNLQGQGQMHPMFQGSMHSQGQGSNGYSQQGQEGGMQGGAGQQPPPQQQGQ